MTRTLTCFIALCALGAPALAGGSLATAEASTASAKSDFVFGQTTYRRSDTNIVADGISMRPSQSSSTPSTLYVATDDGGNLTLDGAWQQDVGDVSKLVTTKGGDLAIASDDLTGLGLAISLDGKGASTKGMTMSVVTGDEDGGGSALDVAVTYGSRQSTLVLSLSGDAADAEACALVFFLEGAITHEESVDCESKVSVLVLDPKPVFADIHIPSNNPHPVITHNGDEMYIFE